MTVEFNWTDDWAYGGHNEGHMVLIKEEFVDSYFSVLEKTVKEKKARAF